MGQGNAPAGWGASDRRVCLLVLGMHRSGTSALTRVVSLLGAALPKTLLGANNGNLRGHWESDPLIAYNDRLLQKLGSHWSDWLALDLSRLRPDDLDEIKRDISDLIEQEYEAANLFVLKEPRMCRLAALYAGILDDKGIEPRFFLPIRNPLAVAASLNDRDGMQLSAAGLLWLRHVLDAEQATRHAPRAIVSYEALLSDWRTVMRRAGARISVRWPRQLDDAAEEIEAFLAEDLQHFAPSRREMLARRDVSTWVKQTYQALLDLEKSPDDDRAIDTLDEVRNAFEAGCAAFGGVFRAERQGRERAVSELKAREQRLMGELRAHATDIAALRSQLTASEDSAAVLEGTVKGLGAQTAGRLEEITDLKTLLGQRDAEIAELRVQAPARRPRLEIVNQEPEEDQCVTAVKE